MNTKTLTITRTVATVIITGLTAAFAYYPHLLWIPSVIAAAATLGIHAIPSIGQTVPLPNVTAKPVSHDSFGNKEGTS
jgi:hypothetical protein